MKNWKEYQYFDECRASFYEYWQNILKVGRIEEFYQQFHDYIEFRFRVPTEESIRYPVMVVDSTLSQMLGYYTILAIAADGKDEIGSEDDLSSGSAFPEFWEMRNKLLQNERLWESAVTALSLGESGQKIAADLLLQSSLPCKEGWIVYCDDYPETRPYGHCKAKEFTMDDMSIYVDSDGLAYAEFDKFCIWGIPDEVSLGWDDYFTTKRPD